MLYNPCLDTILLRQGPKGVPIGGVLLAQIMVLCAIYRESAFFFSEKFPHNMSKLQSALSKKKSPPCTFTPGPRFTFPQDIVLPKNQQFFSTYGMRGWCDQTNKTMGWVTLGEITFNLQVYGTHSRQGALATLLRRPQKRRAPCWMHISIC